MCIIVAKDKKAPLPTKKTLKTCFENNPDGSGFMYVNKNKKVEIDKGYMTFNSFYKHYQELRKEYNNFKNKSLVMHFRIGTGGTNSEINTHPYPISNKIEDLHALHITTDLGVAHNGIISHYNNTDKKLDINDTQNFIRKYLYKLYIAIPNFYKDEDLMYGIKETCGSKLCLLDTKENLYYVGDFIEDNKIMYSNGNYENNYYYYPKTNNYLKNDYYGYYDYDRDDYYGYYDSYYPALDTNFTKSNKNYTKLKKDWTILYEDDTIDLVDVEDFYYIDKEGKLYLKEENDYVLFDINVRVYDEYGRKVS